MNIPFGELVQLASNHNQVWPNDLVEGLEEDDPHIFLQSKVYADLISSRKRELEYSTSISSLPSLIVPGWDNVQNKGQKNWADFENLLFFYALGKIQTASYKAKLQKEDDLKKLREVIEKFPLLKGKKAESAEQRASKDTTYLAFGRKVIDSLINNDLGTQHDLNREILDAEETNGFNAGKLKRSRAIAQRVFHTLKNRYNENS